MSLSGWVETHTLAACRCLPDYAGVKLGQSRTFMMSIT